VPDVLPNIVLAMKSEGIQHVIQHMRIYFYCGILKFDNIITLLFFEVFYAALIVPHELLAFI